MELTNNNKPSSLPTNYVTILELKERWLKEKERQREEEERRKNEEERRKNEEERQRKEKEQEEEELQQQKLRDEQAKQQKQNAIVLKTRTDSRPRNGSNRTQFRPVNRRNVSDCEGAELEGKKQTVIQKTETDFKTRNRSHRTQFGPVNRSVSECEGAELEVKKQPVVQKTETDFKPRNPSNRTFRPVNRSVSECEGAELEGKKSDEPEEKKVGKKKKWKKKRKNVRAEKEEVTEKEGTVDAPQASSEKGDDQATGKEEKRPEIEIRAKSENVVPAVEIVPKFRDLSLNGETGKGDDELKRPRIVDRRGNGEYRGFFNRRDRFGVQKQRGYAGRVWVKKGEVADDNGGGVQQSLERNDVISGQTGTSSNSSSLKFARGMSRNNPG